MNQIQEIPLKELKGSPTNPRKTFDQTKLKDLADSMKAGGQLSAALVRPWPKAGFKGYEVIAGERRLRAAALAGLAVLRCEVKKLDDRTVAEIQLVENVQRDDLQPMEEAEAYGRLVDELKMKVEEIATRTGKSRAYIFSRLGLLTLSPKVRAAVAKDKLPLTWALELRRVGQHVHQEELLKSIERDRFSSLKALRNQIEEDYLLELAKAAFSKTDPDLVPKAGACMTCPKRTGHQADLFGEAAKTDTCTDGACFTLKLKAHGERLVQKAKHEHRKVVTGPEADKLIQHGDDWGAQVAFLDERMRGLHQDQKLGALLKKYDPKQAVEVITALDSRGMVRELVRVADVRKITPKKLFYDSGDSGSRRPDPAVILKKALTNKAGRQAWAALWPKVIEKLELRPFSGAHLRTILGLLVSQTDYKATRGFNKRNEELVKAGKRHDYDESPEDLIRTAKTDAEALHLVYHVVLGDGLNVFDPSRLDLHTEEVLKLVGVDFKKEHARQMELIKQARAERKAAKAAPAKRLDADQKKVNKAVAKIKAKPKKKGGR